MRPPRTTARNTVAALAVCLACARADSGPGAATDSGAGAGAGPASLEQARTAAARRYAQHFAGGQGFSVDTLRARRDWFTPRLYELMLADMGHPEDGIGYIEADPFVDGQEEAARYAIGRARPAHDTALVDVVVTYPADVGSGRETRTVTLALLPSGSGWQIADFSYAHGSLAAGLAEAARSTRR